MIPVQGESIAEFVAEFQNIQTMKALWMTCSGTGCYVIFKMLVLLAEAALTFKQCN